MIIVMATLTTEPYAVSAAARDGWSCRLQVPLYPYSVVCASLGAAARHRDIPITAAVRGSAGDVTEIVLLRDPSARFGTSLGEASLSVGSSAEFQQLIGYVSER
ncbi:hypothetical protein DL991_10650 [Amycolatopsis sp. WAC 01375]|nr:hypothetical protein DL991_10650 [Amycolatopsis sp. WAC 01375]